MSKPSRPIAPITAARSTLGDGRTRMTKPTSTNPANATEVRRPISRPSSSTAPHTMDTLAPDTAIRCVSPDVRNIATVCASSALVSPSTRPGSSAASPAGSAFRETSTKRSRIPLAAP
ncbi:Uncharacterised protein [Mycobacteroides abscessus subsp. abscessus]|nr:Uncharacterised protein [Mycobacteroides abscessus subsp. abscessus]